MKNRNRTIISVLIVVLLFLSIPLSVVLFGICITPQFGSTYYAELPYMVERIKNTEGKRIVIVGGSAVAFGLRNDKMEEELSEYSVCPFGLYGAIGTKAMMELSRNDIRKDDIVILAPEQYSQSLSTYFGGKYLWRAIEKDMTLIGRIDYSDLGGMVGAFPEFISDRYGYWINGNSPSPDGVYGSSSFNEECMLVYDRPHNVMPGGFDDTSLISFGTDVVEEKFIDYVNEYESYVRGKGAKLYFGFASMNASAIAPGTTEGDIDAYYDYLDTKLNCEILGNPRNYIYDCEWFYDNNVHCNSAGALLYTRTLVKDLKAVLGNTSPTEIIVPEKPELPAEDIDGEGDNSYADCFTYGEVNGRTVITGLTQKGKNSPTVIVPFSYGGKRITSFTADTFAGNTVITQITLQSNIRSISDGSFNGCVNLKRLYVAEKASPSTCIVQSGLLDGAPQCLIYVRSNYLANYATDYFWSRYSSYMIAY